MKWHMSLLDKLRFFVLGCYDRVREQRLRVFQSKKTYHAGDQLMLGSDGQADFVDTQFLVAFRAEDNEDDCEEDYDEAGYRIMSGTSFIANAALMAKAKRGSSESAVKRKTSPASHLDAPDSQSPLMPFAPQPAADNTAAANPAASLGTGNNDVSEKGPLIAASDEKLLVSEEENNKGISSQLPHTLAAAAKRVATTVKISAAISSPDKVVDYSAMDPDVWMLRLIKSVRRNRLRDVEQMIVQGGCALTPMINSFLVDCWFVLRRVSLSLSP